MRKILFILGLLGFSLILTACGESKRTAEFKVELLDVLFRPNEFTVPAGAEVTVTATNYGLGEHDFIIFKKDTDAGGHFGHEDKENIFWRLEVYPNATVTETFTAPTEPGTYYIACGVREHLEAGMVGTLIVVE